MNYSVEYQNPNFQIIGLLNEHLIEKGPDCLGGVWGYQENNESVLWLLIAVQGSRNLGQILKTLLTLRLLLLNILY